MLPDSLPSILSGSPFFGELFFMLPNGSETRPFLRPPLLPLRKPYAAEIDTIRQFFVRNAHFSLRHSPLF